MKFFFVLLFLTSFADANPLLGRGRPPGKDSLGISIGTSYSQDATSDEAQKIRRHDSRLVLPLFLDGLSLSLRYQETILGNSDITLEDSTVVGHELASFQAGLSYSWRTAGGYDWSLGGSFGSTSDQVFDRSGDNSITANISLMTPGESSRWMLGVFYSNSSSIAANIPLPIVAYFYRPSKNFHLVFGVPFFSVRWGSFTGTSLSLSLSPNGADAKFSQSILGPVGVFARWQFRAESFFHVNRLNEDDRFFIEEKRASAGLRIPIPVPAMLTIAGGYRYNSDYFQAENFFDERLRRFDIEDSVFFEIQLNANF